MEHPIILVADGDPKNLQILRESLEAAGFGVILAPDGTIAWQKSREETPDLILSEVNLPKLDGFQLLEKLKSEVATSSIPLMFLTNRREIQDRVRSLRGGVKDYMIKPLHVKEVIGRIRMILGRIERMKEDEIDANRKLVGRLEEFSVVDLIESFGVERKSGILTLHNEHNKIGEIYFRDGAVINAALGNVKAEKAVYRMLPWRRGHFTMLFREVNVPDDISISNLGLLLQGFKRMEERERLFKQLPSPEIMFVTTDEFRQILAKREITTDVAKFIAIIDGKRDILQIIDESTYDDLKALERLVKLYRQGLIKPSNAAALPASPEEEVDITSAIAEPHVVNHMSANGEHMRTAPIVQQRFDKRIEKVPYVPANGPTATPRMRENLRTPEKPPVLPPIPAAKLPEPAPEVRRPIEMPARMNRPTPSDKSPIPDARSTEREPDGRKPIALPPRNVPSPLFDKPVEHPSIPAMKIQEAMPEARKVRGIPPRVIEPMPREDSPLPPLMPEARTPDPPPERRKTKDLPARDLPPTILENFELPVREKKQERPPEEIAPIDFQFVKRQDSGKIITPYNPPKPAASEGGNGPVSHFVSNAPEPVFTPPPAATPAKSDIVTSNAMRLIATSQSQKPKLAILGRAGLQVENMLLAILGPESRTKKVESATFQHLEIGERKLGDLQFEIIGLSMEQQFTRLLDTVARDLVGYIVLVEANRKEDIDYLNYLMGTLKTLYPLPMGIAVVKSSTEKNLGVDTLRDLLGAEAVDYVRECDPSEVSSITEFWAGFCAEENLRRWAPSEKTGSS